MKLIFCACNNKYYAEIAISEGYYYGAQLPCNVAYKQVYFADQNWKNPNKTLYITEIKKYKPEMATVIDLEFSYQKDEVISWAEEISPYVSIIIIIPKIHNIICELPREINGKEIRLGYSVPTSHGGTEVQISEFTGWSVHLLGGSPGKQMELASYMNVQSADGNMMMKMANRGLYWMPGKSRFANKWVSLKEMDGQRFIGNGNHEAFRRSCKNIMSAWRSKYKINET
jgi:hypothetical protein